MFTNKGCFDMQKYPKWAILFILKKEHTVLQFSVYCFCLCNSVISDFQVHCFDNQNKVAALCVGTGNVLFAQQYNLLLSKNNAICFSRHSGPPLVDSSSYFNGIGVLGSAAGRSPSFLTLLSTDFKPCKKKSFNSPWRQYLANTEYIKSWVLGETSLEIWW